MKRFRNLVAVLNGGPGDAQLQRRANALALANGAALTYCAPHEEPPVSLLKKSRLYRELDRLVEKERRSSLDRAVEAATNAGIAAEALMLRGKTFVAVIQAVLLRGHDLVLYPDDETTSLHRPLFGSTATHLLRKCPCPVWVLKPSREAEDGRIRKVLAAINAATGIPSEQELNTKILELATSLARREGAETHVVHCWAVYGESLLASRGRMTPEELDEYRAETLRIHRKALEDAVARFVADGHDVRMLLRKGDPGLMIPELAETLPADVVVMGTVARTGINGVFIGNTAESVLQRIGCSVLAVKPDGFSSPVSLE
ncbi:MAG: universal stress protein [Thermoanaerobaculales bacterium]|nr:universal stress protein [Thermoanaerobaculales bacterium]